MKLIHQDLHVYPRALITDAIRQTITEQKNNLCDVLEAYEERAAIMEFGAGLSREEAETLAETEILNHYGECHE